MRDGALIQVTAAHLEDATAPALLELAQAGLVHLLGSDSHSSRAGRPVRLWGARRARDRPALDAHLDWIAREAPAAILRGEDVEPRSGQLIRPSGGPASRRCRAPPRSAGAQARSMNACNSSGCSC